MDLEQLRELIQIFEQADISELEVEEENSRISLKKKQQADEIPPHTHIGGVPSPGIEQTAFVLPESSAPPRPLREQEPETEGQPGEEVDESLVTIDSPMVGVFYAAPAPNEPPFVRAGDTIQTDDTVCIVEAMKLMNEVTSKFDCVIEKVLVENAEPVEYGQPLFSVRPLD